MDYICPLLERWSKPGLSVTAIPHDWAQLISAVLESGLQLHWRCFLKEEVRNLEQQERVKGTEISSIKF